MKISLVMMFGLLVSACSTHRAVDIRCDGPLVPINSGGSSAAAPVAESNHTTRPEGDEPHGE
jgi:hypothetical protein